MPRTQTLTGRREREQKRSLMSSVREHQKKAREAELEYAANFEIYQRNLYRSSQQYLTINLETSDTWDHLNLNKEDGSISVSNSLKKYEQRPTEYEQMSMSNFFTKTYKRGSTYSMRRVPFILRVVPKVKYDPTFNDNETFYRQQVLLHVAWRQLNDLNPDNDGWKVVYERYFKNNSDIISYEFDQMLQNLEDEEDEDSSSCLLKKYSPRNGFG